MGLTLLPSEVETPETGELVLADFKRQKPAHGGADAVFEHGHWWVSCRFCGGQWDAVDAVEGFEFERVTEGDGTCRTVVEQIARIFTFIV